MKGRSRLVVTRHSTLERLSHYVNILSLAGLAASGFTVYFGLPYLDFSTAYTIHILCAAVFLAVNWIVRPYSAIVDGRLAEKWFTSGDARRLWGIVDNFLTGAEYPRYTVYDERKHRFRNRMHPVSKLLLYVNYVALFLATITGVVLYSTSLSVLGLNLSGIVLTVLDFVSPLLTLSGMELARVLHLAAAYWFVIGVVLHAGLVQLDPRKFQHAKAMFLTGTEDLMTDPTAEILNMLEDDE
ncbi:MAG TPA: cytochrome b/b6 domain-containing protein [Methanocella sp.]|nr:cytochrome b/b6 domain-containing protein [Methanocella sp.]